MEKRVAIIAPTFPPYRGGIGKVAETDARQLTALGFEASVFTPERRREKAAGAPYVIHRLRTLGRFGNAALAPGSASLIREYPLVILHYPFFGCAEFVALGKRLMKGSKLIIAYHMDVVGKGAKGAVFRLHTDWCMPWILRAADRILVTSADYASTGAIAHLFSGRRERFAELPPAVDTRRFAPGPKPSRLLEKHGLSADDRIVLFVGGLDRPHYFKGVPMLLAALAVKELAAAKAVIVGDGDLREEYERLARKPGLENRVIFAGAVSEEDLPDYYRLGDIFAFPSVDRSEAFGIAVLEALSSGVPVVASDLAGVRTVVRHGENGYRVFPGSASALAFRLAELLGDHDTRRRFGENGREMAVREYSDAARLAKWKDVLAALT